LTARPPSPLRGFGEAGSRPVFAAVGFDDGSGGAGCLPGNRPNDVHPVSRRCPWSPI